jgi:hypothetical protein
MPTMRTVMDHERALGRRVAENGRDCSWHYVVTHCDTTPALEDPPPYGGGTT